MIVGVLEAILQLRDELTPGMNGVFATLDKLGAGVTKAGLAITPLSAGIAALGVHSLEASRDINANLGNVAALLTSVGSEQIPEILAGMKTDVQDLAIKYGKSTEDIGKGLYEVVSILGKTDETMAQVEISAKAGAAGLATTDNAFNALAATALTYGNTSKEAFTKIADLSFQAVNLGKITFPELSAAIGNVAPAAARNKVPLDQLYAALATASGVTGTVSQGTTQLTSALNSLENPTSNMKKLFKELNVETGKQAIEQYGLVEVFKKVMEYQEKTGVSLMSLTRRKEANTIVTSLGTQQYKRYNEYLNEMGVAAAANGAILEGAFQRQTQTINKVGFQWEQLKSKVQVFTQHIGDVLMPVLGRVITTFEPLVPMLQKMVDWFGTLPQPIQDAAIALGVFLAALGPLVLATGGLILAYTALLPFFPAISIFFNGLAPVVVGAGVAIYALIRYWDDLKDAMNVLSFTPLFEFLAGAAIGVLDLSTVAVRELSAVVKSLSLGFIDAETAVKNASTFFDALRLTWIATKSVVVDLAIATLMFNKAMMFDWNPLKAGLQADIDLLKDLKLSYSDAANAIVNGTEPVVSAVKKVSPELEKLKNTLNEGADASHKASGAHAKTAAELKKLAAQHAAAEKEAKKLAIAEIKFLEILDGIAFKTGMTGLDTIFKDADKAARDLYQTTLPLSVQINEARNAAKAAKDATTAWNLEVDRLGKLLKWPQEEIDKLKKKTDEAKTKSFDWGKALDTVADVFKILGVEADSSLMKAVTALTGALSITKNLKKSLDDAGVSAKDFLKLDSAKQGEIAMAGLNTAMIAFKSGALGGAAAGAQFGSMFGGVGIAIGGAIGGLLGWIGGADKALKAAQKLREEINKMRDDFVKSAGGMEILQSKAKEAGLTLERLFNAKTVREYNDAVDELNKAFDDQKAAHDALAAAMEKYGITIMDLGPKWRQQEMDKLAGELLRDYALLSAAGVDHNLIVAKMGPELNKYVQQSIAAGTAIPENMRPILQLMVDLGLLTDEAGNKMENLDGLTFTETLEEGLKRVIKAIEDLVAALTGIRPPEIVVPYRFERRGEGIPGGNTEGGEGPNGEIPAAKGFDGWVNGPTRFLTGEAGPEHVKITPAGQMPSGAGSDQKLPDMYFILDAGSQTARQVTPAEARKYQAALNSGVIKIASRTIAKKAS